MSEHGQRQRAATEPREEGAQHDDARFVGRGVAADRAWAQQRIRNHFAANRAPSIFAKPQPGVIFRKPQPGTPQHDYKKDSGRQRAEQRVAGADQPLEPGANAHPKAAQHGHGHADHGHQTTMDQQKQRVVTGQTASGRTHYPDNTPLPPRSKSSRFLSPQHEAEALGRARRELQQKLDAKDPLWWPPTNPDGSPKRPEGGIVVTTNRPEGFGDRAVKVPNVQPRQAAADTTTVLRRAQVVYEYVQSLGDGSKEAHWRPVTYFPIE